MAIIESEQELEDHLYKVFGSEEDGDLLGEYCCGGRIFRQVNIAGYGIIDLISVSFDPPGRNQDYPCVYISIIELKKGKIDYEALGQLSRYRSGIKDYVDDLRDRKSRRQFQYDIQGILIGQNVNKDNDFVYLSGSIDWLTILIYSITLGDGLMLENFSGGWLPKGADLSSLDQYKHEIVPDFFNVYKSWRRYLLKHEKAGT